MINFRLINSILGLLLCIEGGVLVATLGIALYFGEPDWWTFGLPALVALLLGLLLLQMGRHAANRMCRRDGYLIVSFTWVLFSLVGMLPFLIGGHTDRVSIAFFETMSGFSTTGATAFADVDALPHSILFWRGLMHWLGGMGIVFFTLAVLPQMGSGEQKLFSAEATGLKLGKLHPRISTTAHWLWGLYLMLTVTCTTAYYVCGMTLFDALCHAFSTVATGGFSTHTASFAYFQSPALEYVAVGFMFLASINFALLYLLLVKRRFRQVRRDDEFRFFTGLVLGSAAYIAVVLMLTTDMPAEGAFRAALFNVVSLQSTTGFTTVDFTHWHPTVWMLLTVISCIGSCAGSTSGGIKCVRIITLIKLVRNEINYSLHPRAVLQLRVCNQPITYPVVRSIFVYLTLYVMLLMAGIVALLCMDITLVDAIGLCISSFSNIGPSFGEHIGPLEAWGNLPDGALWINSFLMLAGRLEVFSLLLPFFPKFWKSY